MSRLREFARLEVGSDDRSRTAGTLQPPLPLDEVIHELFEQELCSRGDDVKVTRSSSDDGVDAVAFDPDSHQRLEAKRYYPNLRRRDGSRYLRMERRGYRARIDIKEARRVSVA